MKKAFLIILAVMLILSAFVSCNYDDIVDDAFAYVTISFDANGGTGTMAPVTVKRGATTELPAVKFSKTGCEFIWWEDGNGNAYSDKSAITPEENMVLTAQWLAIEDITSSTTTMTPGKAYRMTADTTISERITIGKGDEPVVIILTEGTTLTASKGIEVEAGSILYIQDSGALVATGTGDDAGIGSGKDKDSGVIVIESGIIKATGGENGGAGIGSGNGGKGGTISIEDGIIKATGGENGGAGIGGGNGGNGGTISIEGGDIISEGGNGGAGIGGGNGKGGETINISGGEIISLGGEGGAGIGGGKNGGSGTITIDGTDKDKPKILAAGGDGPEKTNGIGKGAGAIGEDDIIIKGIRFKCAPEITEETLWEAYDPENPNPDTIMKTFSDDDVTVTFDANGGTGEMAVQVVPAGKKTELAPNAFEKTGRSFGGWAESATGTKVYDDYDQVKLSANTVLYAVWEEERTPITEDTEVLIGGVVYETTTDTFIDRRIEVTGEDPVIIVLKKGTTLEIEGGIHMPEGTEIIIEGKGTLIADATDNPYSAGIGGDDKENGGDLTVRDGVIEAKGGNGGAGIGGGRRASSCGGDGGVIIVEGGVIVATGGTNGAGIGGGAYGDGGTFVIEDGEVTAKGGESGAGIGGGRTGEGGDVTINGGSVNAESGSKDGHGIGNGSACTDEEPEIHIHKDVAVQVSEDGKTWDDFDPKTENRKQYMKSYTAVTITYNKNGGTSGTMPDKVVAAGEKTKLDHNRYKKTGESFYGWAENEDGPVVYADRAEVTFDESITLYAVWGDKKAIIIDENIEEFEGGETYEVAKDTTISRRIEMSEPEPVILVLKAGTTLTITGGIHLPEGTELTIEGTGTLVADASGSANSAGIGGNNGENAGKLTVESGTVTAKGGTDAAGIGGGNGGGGGTVIIGKTGSKTPLVTATAGGAGAHGIGRGTGTGTETTVTLNGGIGLEASADDSTWEDCDAGQTNRKQYMRTFTALTITFEANGGTGTMDPQPVHSGVQTKLNANAYKMTGKSFDGWATEAGGAMVYKNKADVTITENLTLYARWKDQTAIPIEKDTDTFEGGEVYTTVDETTTIPKRVNVTGTGPVTIILAEGTTLTITGGIHLPEGKELTIQGTGKLVADASAVSNSAGIGGNENESAGKLTVEGGIIEAKGGYYAAGIGGGKGKDGGDILITAGAVTAIGNGGGAGIGGASSGKGGKTTISGGTVTATGGYKGAGIGAGAGAWGDGGEILITGGTVTAKGDGGGAGIGGGYGGKGGKITIESGTVTATGGVYNQGPDYGAGIGGGGYGGASGTITIGKTGVTAPVVTATAGGAGTHGIGKGSGNGQEDKITLNVVALEASADNKTWEDINAEQTNRDQYMRAYTTVTITFDKNGGEGTMTAQTVHSGVETALKANTYTYDGYEFAGWAETSTGTKKYDDKASVTLTKDTTLYALWEKSEYVAFPTTEPVTLTGGKKYKTADGTTTLTQRIRISGTDPVTIKVSKGSTLDTKGITVTSGQTLILNTEDGSRLIADALNYGNNRQSSAIGGEDYQQYTSCGTIVINGTGTVIATGGVNGGAGIGGSRNENGGDITINGGTIFAYGRMGAGIGGGGAADGGTTTINDGVVLAIGYAGGAGIGGGTNETQGTGGNGGEINILGGAVFATAAYGSIDDGAAGIGGGTRGNSGTITIKGTATSSPTIFATGGTFYTGNANGIGNGGGSTSSAVINVEGVTLQYRNKETETWTDYIPDPYSSTNGLYGRTKGTVSISFDANGGSGSMSPLTGIQIGDSVALTKNTFTNGDKIFMGWNTQPSGNGIGCADESSFFGLMDVTLYAQWADGYTTMTSSDKVLKGGTAYEVSSSLYFNNQEDRLTIDGTTPVLIYIKDGKSLDTGKGITVAGGQTLIINADSDSTSYLYANAHSGSYYGAGIGAGNETTCGTIIINGGRITAEGHGNSAGIGGGEYYPGYNNGVVVINGGDVTATGREAAAGIGGGQYGDGGVITINGGTVKASTVSQSQTDGAGIGGGRMGSGGVITITGGTVTATGSTYGAGIGGGCSVNTGDCDGGFITISGGTVYAYGGKSASGIGGGFKGDGRSITISGGTVYAFGGDYNGAMEGGAGIGGGAGGNSGTISIKKAGEVAPVIYAVGGEHYKQSDPDGIGRGGGASTSSTAINLSEVTLERSYDKGNTWSPSDGSTSQRAPYMRTKDATPPTT